LAQHLCGTVRQNGGFKIFNRNQSYTNTLPHISKTMNKKTIKVISILVITVLLIYGGNWIFGIYQFARGVQEDTPKFVESLFESNIQNGDIIFHTSKSSQSKAIQLATNSKYSHMGIIYKINGELLVYEAVQPVKLTKLNVWIKRGENGHYVIKRLKDSDKVLTKAILTKMQLVGEKYKGKNYDLYFDWSDDKIYCSELVWKIYNEGAGIEIGELEQLSDFNLKSKIVQQKMKERYGDNIPMDEKVISPSKMFNSEKLKIVMKN